MLAIWQYTAGLSLLLPTVRNIRLMSENTSAMMVSTRLGSYVDFGGLLGLLCNADSEASSRIALSFVTGWVSLPYTSEGRGYTRCLMIWL
jgi:hypothetical protein